MSNTFITPSVIASRALATLYNSTVFLPLVLRDYDAAFTGKQGDTVSIKTPAQFEAKTFDRNTGIEPQAAVEGSETITLDTILDVSFEVNNEELLLEVDDFAAQLANPAMEALAQKIDADLAAAVVEAANGTTATASGEASTVFTGDSGARAVLNGNNIPSSQRYAVMSAEAGGVCLTDELFVAADKSGWTDSLREGSLGRVFGFDTYESNALEGVNGVAFHTEAVAFVSRSLGVPVGAPAGTVADANYKGLGLRVGKTYDLNYKKDVVSVDLLCGTKVLRSEGAVELNLGIGS